MGSAEHLQKIARTLDVPVATFFGGNDNKRLTQASELLRLFDAIGTDAGRQKVLELAHTVAAESKGVPSVA